MAIADLLNADLPTIGRMIGAGVEWWVGELAAMLPERWRAARAGGIVAELQPGGGIACFRDGRRLASVPRHPRVTLAIPAAQALVREVILPRLPKRDTRRLLALDLDRLTPFSAETALGDFEPMAGPVALDRQQVRLAVVRREDAALALALAGPLDLEPVALAVSAGEGSGRAAFDFLPQLRAEAPEAPLWTDPRAWWAAAAALALANVGLAIYLDAADVGALRDTVLAQDDAVQLAQRLKGRVRAEDGRRAAKIARRAAQDPLGPLAAATVAIPAPAWVQRATWTGQSLRLAGFSVEGVDAEASLRRSPAFAGVRATSSDIPPTTPRYQPFDLTAQARQSSTPAPRR